MNDKKRLELIRELDKGARIDGYVYVGWERRALKRLKELGYDFVERKTADDPMRRTR